MTHSRIFQLSKEPISLEEDGISVEDFYQDDYDPCCKPIFYVADYVNADTNREDDIKWFIGTLPEGTFSFGSVKDEDTHEEIGLSIIFHEGFKEAYFGRSLQEFLHLAEAVKQNNKLFYDRFQAYLIRMAVEDNTSFYIYLDENGYEVPMDRFVRDYLKIGQRYYFGNTIDYHY